MSSIRWSESDDVRDRWDSAELGFGDTYNRVKSPNEAQSNSPAASSALDSSLELAELRIKLAQQAEQIAALHDDNADLRRVVQLQGEKIELLSRHIGNPPTPPAAASSSASRLPAQHDGFAVFERFPKKSERGGKKVPKMCNVCPCTDEAERPEARHDHVELPGHQKLMIANGKPKYYCKGQCTKQMPRYPRPIPGCLQSMPVDKTCDEHERALWRADDGHEWCCICGGAFVLQPVATLPPKKKARKHDVAHSSTSLAGSQVSPTTGGDEAKG